MSEDEGYANEEDEEGRGGRQDFLGLRLKESALHEGGFLTRNIADR